MRKPNSLSKKRTSQRRATRKYQSKKRLGNLISLWLNQPSQPEERKQREGELAFYLKCKKLADGFERAIFRTEVRR